MKIDAKLLLLLFGALMLVSAVYGQESASQLSPEDKRRIVKSMLYAQKDIRKALLKIKRQIMGDGKPDGSDWDNGHGEDDGEDDDGGDDDDFSGEEDEEHFKEQQRKIREAREQLEAYVKQIASSFIAMHEFIEKIDNKINEEIKDANSEVNYNLYYAPGKPHHHGHGSHERPDHPPTRPTWPPTFPTRPTKKTRPTWHTMPTRDTEPPTLPTTELPEPGYPSAAYKRTHKRPYRNSYRGSRALDETIPTVDAETLSSPDIPSVVTYDGPVQKSVEFQLNQQQVEK